MTASDDRDERIEELAERLANATEFQSSPLYRAFAATVARQPALI